ncbi:potassium channel family protein [Halobium salinum]|uniref:Potassium channel family protein n=1 Tax=Halobium salinum TaxID=1364940 RepID=A0ABD5PES3_9EURY|nr:NAD-binding protein [Halobium salinum]
MSSRKRPPLEQQVDRLRAIESLGDLSERQRKVLKFGTGLVALLLVYTFIYQVGMARLEGRPRSFPHSLQIIVQTMTTTGFGGDAPWETAPMNLLMTWYQITGVVIGFVTLRILIIPLFERAPVVLDERLTTKRGHVVVCEYGRGKDVLLDELEASDAEYVLVDSDEEEAIALSNRDYQAIDGDPTETATLERASVGDAAFVVTDAHDRNASVTLTARQLNDDARAVCLTETETRREALERVGADRVVCPPRLVGERLAEKAAFAVGQSDESAELGGDVVVRELPVRRGGPLDGTRVGDTPVAADPDLSVVAAWVDGDLHLPPRPDERLPSNGTLVVIGPESAFESLYDALGGTTRPAVPERVVVVGLGEAGRAAVDALPDRVAVTTVDVRDDAGADIVGDATERSTLVDAGLGSDESTALLVAVNDDDTTLLTVAMARAMDDDTEVLARVADAENVRKAFDAGADYALSEQSTTARTLAAEIHGDPDLHPVGEVRFVRLDGDSFAGRALGEVTRDWEAGVAAVGVRRDGALLVDDGVQVDADDEVVLVGTDERLRGLGSDVVTE